MCRTLSAVVSIGLFVALQPAVSAPLVQQISGTMDHKGTITINGTGFGSKPAPPPLAWDDATGSNILDKWDGAWPNLVPGSNIGYYSPMRGVSPPHNHDSRFIAGAHKENTGFLTGYDVVFFKNIDLQPFPFYIYASWYQRADSGWQFTSNFPGNNFKTFAYSNCCSPYEMPNNWFTVYGPPQPSSNNASNSPMWIYTDDGNSLLTPLDANGHNAWWGHGVNPMAGKWAKVEIAVKVTNQTNGYIKVWEDGRQVMNYAGSTDKYPGNRRTIGIGGYTYPQNPQNWRYYADAYLDVTLSRVVLANNAALSKATVIENQIPSQWDDSSITATVNLGHFQPGDTAYLFVVDSSGTPNPTGLAVTAGGTAAAAPRPPAGVVVH